MKKSLGVIGASAALLLAFGAVPAADAVPVSTAVHYTSCKAFNKKYPHGVGRKGAKDKSSGKKVTNFKRSNKIYYRYSAGKAKTGYYDLDRDNDGIACEKR